MAAGRELLIVVASPPVGPRLKGSWASGAAAPGL